jgi:spermidine synthase
MTLVLAAIIWSYSPLSPLLKRTFVGGVILSIATMVFFHTEIYSHILEKLHYKTAYLQKKPYKYVIQNRSGIITVESGLPDIVYGGGIYDGRINIDPVLNSNLITRAYLIAALHPTPQDVLEIGMSGGSWSRVMANHTSVKNLSIIEINPGYVNLIKQYPEIATILHDPKITIQIDDGRRWLNRNPDKKFDVIVMNTTFHWRDGITNLLSEEFLRLCKSHLKEGGILYYNMTFSKDVPFTAAQVFRHVALHRNLVIASDSPLAMNVEERKYNLMKFEHLGTPFFDKNNSSLQKVLEELSTVDLTDEAEIIRSMTGLWHITDDNMATEFKIAMYRSRWTNVYKSEMTWKNLIKMRIQH